MSFLVRLFTVWRQPSLRSVLQGGVLSPMLAFALTLLAVGVIAFTFFMPSDDTREAQRFMEYTP